MMRPSAHHLPPELVRWNGPGDAAERARVLRAVSAGVRRGIELAGRSVRTGAQPASPAVATGFDAGTGLYVMPSHQGGGEPMAIPVRESPEQDGDAPAAAHASPEVLRGLAELLRLPVATGSTARRDTIRQFFLNLPPLEAARLHVQLTNRDGPVHRELRTRLDKSSRSSLLEVLRQRAGDLDVHVAAAELTDLELEEEFLEVEDRRAAPEPAHESTLKRATDEARSRELQAELSTRGEAASSLTPDLQAVLDHRLRLREATRTGDYSGIEIEQAMDRLRGRTLMKGTRTAIGYYRLLEEHPRFGLLDVESPSAGDIIAVRTPRIVHTDDVRRLAIVRFQTQVNGADGETREFVVELWWRASTERDWEAILFHAEMARDGYEWSVPYITYPYTGQEFMDRVDLTVAYKGFGVSSPGGVRVTTPGPGGVRLSPSVPRPPVRSVPRGVEDRLRRGDRRKLLEKLGDLDEEAADLATAGRAAEANAAGEARRQRIGLAARLDELDDASLDGLEQIARRSTSTKPLWEFALKLDVPHRGDLLRLVNDIAGRLPSGSIHNLDKVLRTILLLNVKTARTPNAFHGSWGQLYAARTLIERHGATALRFEVKSPGREIDIEAQLPGKGWVGVEVKTPLGNRDLYKRKQVTVDLVRHAGTDYQDLMYLYHPSAQDRLTRIGQRMERLFDDQQVRAALQANGHDIERARAAFQRWRAAGNPTTYEIERP